MTERRFSEHLDRRERSLTDADIEALREAFTSAHVCQYSPEEILDIKRYRRGMNAVAAVIGWGVILLIGAALVWLMAKGATLKGL